MTFCFQPKQTRSTWLGPQQIADNRSVAYKIQVMLLHVVYLGHTSGGDKVPIIAVYEAPEARLTWTLDLYYIPITGFQPSMTSTLLIAPLYAHLHVAHNSLEMASYRMRSLPIISLCEESLSEN